MKDKAVETVSTIQFILDEVNSVLKGCCNREYEFFVSLLKRESRFFFAGEGRSGLVAKMIAMRLMHSGKTVFVIEETTTPAIGVDDVLIILSGSGQTPMIKQIGQSASSTGALVCVVTTNTKVKHFTWCSAILHVPAATKYRLEGEPSTIQPLGNQFDQAAHLLLDAAIIDSLSKNQTNDSLKKQHANLE